MLVMKFREEGYGIFASILDEGSPVLTQDLTWDGSRWSWSGDTDLAGMEEGLKLLRKVEKISAPLVEIGASRASIAVAIGQALKVTEYRFSDHSVTSPRNAAQALQDLLARWEQARKAQDEAEFAALEADEPAEQPAPTELEA